LKWRYYEENGGGILKKKILGSVAVVALAVSLLAFSGKSEPESYNDCILENMKGVESSVAAKLIRNACSDKFVKDELPLVMTYAEAVERQGAITRK
jgi:hypothetical protein